MGVEGLSAHHSQVGAAAVCVYGVCVCVWRSFSIMRVRALVLFISAVAAQHTTSQNLNRDPALSENLNSPELGLSRLRLSAVVRRREAVESEAGRLCVFLREREAEGPLSCKHQLNLRSKFNYNPFGLRFGKRAGENRRRTRPPVLLLLREPQAS